MQKGERTRASGLSLSLSLSLSLALFLSSKRRFQEPLREERKAISNVRKAAKDTKVKGRMKRTKEGGREGGVKGNDLIVKRRGGGCQWQIKVDGAKAGLSEAAWEN